MFHLSTRRFCSDNRDHLSNSPFRRRWFLYGPSIPLFWRGPQHDIGDRHYSPSVAGLIVREITAVSRKQVTAITCPLWVISGSRLTSRRLPRPRNNTASTLRSTKAP